MIITLEGQLWNIEATADYLTKVYSNNNIVKNKMPEINQGNERLTIDEQHRSSNISLNKVLTSLDPLHNDNIRSRSVTGSTDIIQPTKNANRDLLQGMF